MYKTLILDVKLSISIKYNLNIIIRSVILIVLQALFLVFKKWLYTEYGPPNDAAGLYFFHKLEIVQGGLTEEKPVILPLQK